MIKVDANLFRLAYGAISTEETRYYLNGVHIEAHPTAGAIMVSTDGHRMIVVYDPDGICDEHAIVKLPATSLAQCKPAKNENEPRLLTIDTEAKTASIGYAKKVIQISHDVLVDGTFPDWRRVMPKPTKTNKAAPTAFNPHYLGAWGKLGADIAKTIGGSGEVQIALSDGASATMIRFSAPNIFALLMPMRSGISGFLPAFMDSPVPAQIAAE